MRAYSHSMTAGETALEHWLIELAALGPKLLALAAESAMGACRTTSPRTARASGVVSQAADRLQALEMLARVG